MFGPWSPTVPVYYRRWYSAGDTVHVSVHVVLMIWQTDRAVLTVCSVPRFQDRLNFLVLATQLESAVEDIRSKLVALTTAALQVCSSRVL